MDVAEEPELTLQRISPDLLAEFGSLLPGFLWTEPKPEGHSGGASQGDKQQPHISRQLVKESKADKLVRLVRLNPDFVIPRHRVVMAVSRSWSRSRNGHNY